MKKTILLIMLSITSVIPAFAADYHFVMSSRFNPLESEIVEIVEDNHFYTGTYSKGVPTSGGLVDVKYRVRKADMFGDVQIWLESNGSQVHFTLDEYQDYSSVVFNKVTFTIKRN